MFLNNFFKCSKYLINFVDDTIYILWYICYGRIISNRKLDNIIYKTYVGTYTSKFFQIAIYNSFLTYTFLKKYCSIHVANEIFKEKF